jgi:uncharacterized protein (TIGR00288 family)
VHNESRVGIFVDVENLTRWIKHNGIEQLLEDLLSMGTIIVRRAYARWTNEGLTSHQSILNRLGFELIHTFHPVSGKNSADIQIVVDVMEYAWRDPNLGCIALATGDSDFSPLFRRLREMDRQVIGVGPRSALSESVKSSCSRFLYIQPENSSESQDEASRTSAFDDAADLLEKALRTFDGPANCSSLKARMLNIDSAFDEKKLGFKGFNDFVNKVNNVKLTQNGKAWFISFLEKNTIKSLPVVSAGQKSNETSPKNIPEQYQQILRRKNWRSVSLSVIEACYHRLCEINSSPRPEIAEIAIAGSGSRYTTTDIRKVINLLFKAGLMEPSHKSDGEETCWKAISHPLKNVIFAIDKAMLVRLLTGLNETSIPLETKYLSPLLLQTRTSEEIDKLVWEARQSCRTVSQHDKSAEFKDVLIRESV